MLGVSTVSTFAESTAGVADGAKTGLASLVTGSCFLLAIPFSPVVSAAAGLPASHFHDLFTFCWFRDGRVVPLRCLRWPPAPSCASWAP